MDPKHTELEYKFDAEHVDRKEFRRLMVDTNAVRFEHFKHDDVFWKRGEQVLRHRIKGPGAGELTVKKRTSEESLLERAEINLKFEPNVTIHDVKAFLLATGYEQLFGLHKSYVDVFDFERPGFKLEFALYTVGRVDDWGISGVRSFLELEIKPGKEMGQEEAKLYLSYWASWARGLLDLEEPLNISLFEYYSKMAMPAVDATHYRI